MWRTSGGSLWLRHGGLLIPVQATARRGAGVERFSQQVAGSRERGFASGLLLIHWPNTTASPGRRANRTHRRRAPSVNLICCNRTAALI